MKSRVMPNRSKIRIGVLGAAQVAPYALLAPARARRDVEVVCVAARDPLRARAFAAEHGIPMVAESYAALIGRADVDLVYVALPACAHAEWAIRALEAGKAVLCEKPFAMNAHEAEAMVVAARRAGRPLMEAIHYRFHPVSHRAVDLVRRGVLGRIEAAEAEFTYPVAPRPEEIRWRRELGGGALMDDGCYPIHALRTFLGVEPRVVTARSRRARGVDAETWAELDFEGSPAHIHVALETERPGSRIEIRGERGRLSIRNFIVPHMGCRFALEIDGREEALSTDGPATWAAQLDHVVAVLRGHAEPLTGGVDAVANMTVIDAVRAAAVEDQGVETHDA